MKGVEDIGLIKFDFLALKNLTLITDTLTLIKAGGKDAPDLNRLRLDDADTYKMLSRGDTVGRVPARKFGDAPLYHGAQADLPSTT